MKNSALFLCAVLASSFCCAAAAPAKDAKTPPASDSKSAGRAAPAPQPVEIPKSHFLAATKVSEGRNPFFPAPAEPRAPGAANSSASEPVTLVLNGLTGPPKRLAMVNGRTFEAGEIGEVKFRNGARVLLECVEIKDGSAIFKVGGQLKELRLRSGI